MTETVAAKARQESPQSDDPSDVLNRLAQLSIALIPALVAALAAIGGATGGLARLFRDRTDVASKSVLLILLSFALAALARFIGTSSRPIAGGRPGRWVTAGRPIIKALLLLLSMVLLFAGLFMAVNAQIGVMGTSQAPQISGNAQRAGNEYMVEGRIRASGVKSKDRITIYSYQTEDEGVSARKPQLFHSSSGPDADGVVDVPVKFVIHSDSAGAFVVITAVLGDVQRNCEGQVAGEDALSIDTRKVACLVLRLP